MNQYTIETRYKQLKSGYPKYYMYFNNMIKRSQYLGIECAFRYDYESYRLFINVLGEIPLEMTKPSVGRFDHSKGYIFDSERDRWNFRWQSTSENSSESMTSVNLRPDHPNKDPIHIAKWVAASQASPNHSGKKSHKCPECGVVINGPSFYRHLKTSHRGT